MVEFQLNGNITNPSEVLDALNELDSDLGKVMQHIERLYESDGLVVDFQVDKNALGQDGGGELLTVNIQDA